MAERTQRWDWLPAFMPAVQARIAEARQRYGAAHVADCWAKGVIQGLPGYLFAREGVLSVGTPPEGDTAVLEMAFSTSAGQSFLYLRTPE